MMGLLDSLCWLIFWDMTPYSTPLGAARALDERGRQLDKWYAGITDDPEARLYGEHQVRPSDPHFWVWCDHHFTARDAEMILLDWGYLGGPGGGTKGTKCVYVYRTGPHTSE